MLFACLIFVQVLEAQDAELVKANALYNESKYNEACVAYETLLKTYGTSPEVYYNLGNSYYKQNKFEWAILNYERSLKLAHNDDVVYNLKLANMQCVDKIEPLPQVFYQKWWQLMLQKSNADLRAWQVIIALFVFMILAIMFLVLKRALYKRLCFFAAFFTLLYAGIEYILANRQYAYLQKNKAAIIINVSDYVKSSPDTKSSNLFMLHGGTKVSVLDSLHGWHKIKIANGHVGWINSNSIVII